MSGSITATDACGDAGPVEATMDPVSSRAGSPVCRSGSTGLGSLHAIGSGSGSTVSSMSEDDQDKGEVAE